jgi:hypothetical protein
MLDDEVPWGPMCARFAVSLTVVLWLIAATIVPSFLGWFLTPIFMVLFRSAIAPEIACFIGFFGFSDLFLNVLYIWHSTCRLFNARLTEMRCGHLRPGRDFGRSFTHHFWCRFEGQFWTPFLLFFGRRFASISTFPGFEVPFLALFRRVFARTFLFIFGDLCDCLTGRV